MLLVAVWEMPVGTAARQPAAAAPDGAGAPTGWWPAQLEISPLVERLSLLERRRVAPQAEINRLLYRAPDTPLEASAAFEVRPVTESLEALRARAAERYPALKGVEQQVNRGRQALALARKERLPDFAVDFTVQRLVGDMLWMYGLDFMVKVLAAQAAPAGGRSCRGARKREADAGAHARRGLGARHPGVRRHVDQPGVDGPVQRQRAAASTARPRVIGRGLRGRQRRLPHAPTS
ncbi:MAG TPA: hypothetical protein VNK92_02170 [Vicinamibacterales bacterium]|nr:hypothetical protein [Vicinamibacterales bacterium]